MDNIDSVLSNIKSLQDMARELQQELKAAKEQVRHYLTENEVKKYTSKEGITATRYEQKRVNADRDVAAEILSSDQYTAIFSEKSSDCLRVK